MTGNSASAEAQSFKLLCVSEDHSAIAGGAPAVVDQLTRRIAASGYSVDLLFVRSNSMPVGEGVRAIQILPAGLGRVWGWSPELRVRIARLIQATSPVVHLHGIWAAPQYLAARVAGKLGAPFLVSAHGMLEPWLWTQQGWKVRVKKELYWKLFAHPAYASARVIHAITPMERDHLRALIPSSRIEVIPNAIDLEEYPETAEADGRERLILFVGRIEPKKGVDILLRAFAAARLDREWRVVIIGPVWSPSYQLELERIVAQAGLQERVSFLGPVFGKTKLDWIKKAWVLAVPSHSEVIGLVNLEAAACRTPTITTHETGLHDWETGGGLLVHPEVEGLKAALEYSCSWGDSEHQERGVAIRALVSLRYSWKAVLPQWISLYQAIRERG